ncbi:MAG: hypothetical protein COA58_11350 [Bacteroidetes bacterium]|nr:MAG: hypothetical protein COA58_11350 [Bacteroidota bacterium]
MKKTIYLILTLITLASCSSKYEFWDVNKFKISEAALIDNEKVTVIYYSRGPFNDEVEHGFYTHAVVISNTSLDTLNVLTFPDSDLDNITHDNNVLTYNDHPIITDLVSGMNLPKEMADKIKEIDPEKATWEKHFKVVRDPEFDNVADNNYETVIGSLTRK